MASCSDDEIVKNYKKLIVGSWKYTSDETIGTGTIKFNADEILHNLRENRGCEKLIY